MGTFVFATPGSSLKNRVIHTCFSKISHGSQDTKLWSQTTKVIEAYAMHSMHCFVEKYGIFSFEIVFIIPTTQLCHGLFSCIPSCIFRNRAFDYYGSWLWLIWEWKCKYPVIYWKWRVFYGDNIWYAR